MEAVKVVPEAKGYEERRFLRIIVRRYPELPDESGVVSFYAGQWQFRMDMMLGDVQHCFQWLQPSQDSEPAPYPWMVQKGLQFMASKFSA